MARRSFIFWLFSKDKKPLYVASNDIVQEGDPATFLKPDGQPARLQFSPDGWKDTLVKFGRNIKYWGLFRDFTVPMKFKGDGARIAKTAMWNNGVEALVYFAMSKLNRLVFPDKYESWYSGELDFSKFNQKKTDVLLNVMEGGLSKYLKAYETTTYEIPIDADPEAKIATMDGFPFSNKIKYILLDAVYPDPAGAVDDYWFMGLAITAEDGSTQGVLNQDEQYQHWGGYPSDDWFMHCESKNINAVVTGSFKVEVGVNSGGQHVHIFFAKVNNGVSIGTYDVVNAVHNAGEIFVVDINVTIPMAPGDMLYMHNATPHSIAPTLIYQISEGKMEVNYDVTFSQTKIKGVTPLHLFEELTKKISDGKYTASSTFLDSLKDQIMVTSASAIRNHEGDSNATAFGSIIKTSIDEFFRSFKRYGIGLGIENDQLIIEKIEYFFKNDIIITLGEVSEFEVQVAEDISFNTIKVGQANQTYDEVNGKDEFNVTQNYTTPITRIVKELDLISPYRADMYGIELLRNNLSGKDTTDNESDNDTFLINVKKDTTLAAGIAFFENDSNVTQSGLSNEELIIAFIGVDHVYFSSNGPKTVFRYMLAPRPANIHFETVFVNPDNTFKEIKLYQNNTVIASTTLMGNGKIFLDATVNLNSLDTIKISTTRNDIGNYVINDPTITVTFPEVVTFALNRPAFTSISGLLHPAGAFNVLLSPKSALIPLAPGDTSNNGSFIRSILAFQDAASIVFRSGEKNSELSRAINGITVTEKADIPIGSLPARLFLPFYFVFKTEVPIDFLKLIKPNPYGKIEFKYQGQTFRGFLWDGGIKPATNDSQQWKLLASPDNDLKKLIDLI